LKKESEMPTEVPDYTLPAQNRQVLLVRRPQGVPQRDDFSISPSMIPVPGDGQFLVRNVYLSVDPAQRGWASDEANYSEPVPLGAPMRALAVAVVVESQHSDFENGEFLYGWFGWQDYAVAVPSHVLLRARHDLPLTAFASLLGINGITAYLALTQLGRPRSKDTLVVSTAAGSVGSFVGQIGNNLGCRTVGLTGDDRKVERCKSHYRYDEAINYKQADLKTAIEAAAPDRVNVYFDNTGGTILDTVLRQMAVAGRIVQCGTAATRSWTPPPTGPRNEREILTRRLIWSGFVIFDHLAKYAEAADQLALMYRDGAITYDTDLSTDIEQARDALASLYAGDNNGKKLIYIG
jgi:NADPH-dependent curcumin reductase CurA